MTETLLSLRSIGKQFPGVRALDQVSLDVSAKEVVAVVGENGAGKSTLLKILGGIYRPEQGKIVVDGQPRVFGNVRESMDHGIALIHQELNLAGNLNIAENIFLGRQPSRVHRWFPVTNRREMHRRSAALLDMVGLDVATTTLVGRLSVGQQQLVEIAKALSTDARLLVFDEPTSSLSYSESERLLSLIERLRDRGVAILYVSHRLAEVKRIANRVIVLRDGRHVGTLDKDEVTEKRMISLMIGREVQQFYHRESHAIDTERPAIAVRDFLFSGCSQAVDFKIARGEIVGFFGLVGAGRTELARALFGVDPHDSGTVLVDGEQVRIRNPVDAVAQRVALVPEDRKAQGLVLPMSLTRNTSLTVLPKIGRMGWHNRRAEVALAESSIERFAIEATGRRQKVGLLSGGNQQKVVLAKWLATEPKVLILDEPTRGVDVGAKSEIYKLLFELAARGVGLMMISSELEEIIGVADRVIVMRRGKIAGEVTGSEMTEERIMTLAVGSAA